MVRDLAGYDPARLLDVFRWPLREALLAYVERMRESASRQYAHDVQVWATIAPHTKGAKPPAIPAILRGKRDGD